MKEVLQSPNGEIFEYYYNEDIIVVNGQEVSRDHDYIPTFTEGRRGLELTGILMKGKGLLLTKLGKLIKIESE